MQLHHGAAFAFGGLVADRGIALLRFGLHRQLVTKGVCDGIFGAQVHNPLIAINKHRVAIQRLSRDAFGIDHQRDCQGARNDCGV